MFLPLSVKSVRLATAIKLFGITYEPVTETINLPATHPRHRYLVRQDVQPVYIFVNLLILASRFPMNGFVL